MKTDRVKHLALSTQPRELNEIFHLIYLYAFLSRYFLCAAINIHLRSTQNLYIKTITVYRYPLVRKCQACNYGRFKKSGFKKFLCDCRSEPRICLQSSQTSNAIKLDFFTVSHHKLVVYEVLLNFVVLKRNAHLG
jgi:hypothetical protein